jgi:competence protein ComFA
MDKTLLYGRWVVVPKISPIARDDLGVAHAPFLIDNGTWVCRRCQQSEVAFLPNNERYCRQCLALGRISTLDELYTLPEVRDFTVRPDSWCMSWQGTLTQDQSAVSKTLIETWQQRKERLVWAVTGAGKTEMLFPLIETVIRDGGRIAIVSPRIDVINELAPRLQAAFLDVEQMVLHGETATAYRYTQLVLATTHQMLRFYQAFDAIIVDEVDSFPYAGDLMLTTAVRQARQVNSTVIYLTATPTRALQKRVQKGQLPVSYLARRFHGHPLPDIRVKRIGNWRRNIHDFPRCIRRQIDAYAQTGQRFLLFVPHVADLAIVQRVLTTYWPQMKGDNVHAADALRSEKVNHMRHEAYQYLITTTILERGVTFPGIDVIILGAEEASFSVNALVQIAGRVGRGHQRPTGLVQAYVQVHSRQVRHAQQQIRQMNQQGGF